jgi:citrate lyase subunit alpha/citrate CoA-transferase
MAKAREFGAIPLDTETTDEIVHAIEWRDGTLLDVIRRPVD